MTDRDAQGDAEALYERGLRHANGGDHAAAVKCFERVVALDPRHAPAFNALGNMAKLRQDWNAAIESYRRSVALRPESVAARTNLGGCLRNAGLDEEAFEHLSTAYGLDPENALACLNYGLGLLDAGRVEEAESRIVESIRLSADLAEAHSALGTLRLSQGRFGEGWRDYEWRMRSPLWERQLAVSCPVWKSDDISGKTLLVRAEQGLGDQIMFASCLPELIDRCETCLIECDLRLKKLFVRSFPRAHVYARRLKGEPGWLGEGRAPGLQVQIGSLPERLGRDWGRFPALPYLAADPARVAAWRKRLAQLGHGPHIGLSWRGGMPQTRQAARSIPLATIGEALGGIPAQWISLQYGDVEAELSAVAAGSGMRVHHWQDGVSDMDELAALVTALDAVVSVQTAVVHLAGALGRRVWALVPVVPEWRYLREGETMPWYASVRLVRQPRSTDWSDVLERFVPQLQALNPQLQALN